MSSSIETSQPINVVLFGGQGTSSANSTDIRERGLDDACTPAGSILLSACYHVFHEELSSLPLTISAKAGLDGLDFPTAHSLLRLPLDSRYLSNSILSGTTLFLLQALRYLAFIDSSHPSSSEPSSPFTALLEENATHGIGILGFSSAYSRPRSSPHHLTLYNTSTTLSKPFA